MCHYHTIKYDKYIIEKSVATILPSIAIENTRLSHEHEAVLALFDQAWTRRWLITGDFCTVKANGIVFDEATCFAIAGANTSLH